MNLAILSCNKLSYECSGAWCFQAFNAKSKGFEKYKNTPLKLFGFFHCNGCGKDFEKELNYKLEQLKKCNVTQIHMALCTNNCTYFDELRRLLENKNFRVIYGTH